MRFVSRGELPSRRNEPPLSNGAWELIQGCWSRDGAKRPAISDVLERIASWGGKASSETSHDSPPPPIKSKGMNIWQKIKSLWRICTGTRSKPAPSHPRNLPYEKLQDVPRPSPLQRTNKLGASNGPGPGYCAGHSSQHAYSGLPEVQ